MRFLLHILRCIFFPHWLTRPIARGLGRGAQRLLYRLVQVLTVLVAALLIFSLWRELTYTLPAQRVVRTVARAAGLEARSRADLMQTLAGHGFKTLSAGTPRDAVARVFAEADGREDQSRSREAYYFDYLGDHEFGFYLDYDTADRLQSLSWEHNFFWRQPPAPLPLQPAGSPATQTQPR